MYSSNNRECDISTFSQCGFVHPGSDLGFGHSGLSHFHGYKVHIHGNVNRFFNLINLFRSLIIALVYNSFYQFNRCRFIDLAGWDPGQIPERDLILRSIGWQKMYFTFFFNGFIYIILKTAEGQHRINPNRLASFQQRGFRSHPDNVVDGQVISKNDLFPAVNIYVTDQSGITEAKKIEK